MNKSKVYRGQTPGVQERPQFSAFYEMVSCQKWNNHVRVNVECPYPLIKTLAMKEFLIKSVMDVKVVVASCISEITRKTASELHMMMTL